MQMQSLPQLLEPSLGKSHIHTAWQPGWGSPVFMLSPSWGRKALPLDVPGPLGPLAVESSRKDLQRHMVFSLQCPSGKLRPLQFQSLVKCWNTSGAHIIVHRMNEGGNEPSQGEGDIRDVERLNDPAHSTL